MFYSLIILIVFSFVIIIKTRQNTGYAWLTVSILGFCVAIFAFILYVFNLYEYFKIETAYFDINAGLWLFIYKLDIGAFSIYRLLNIGVITFIVSFLNFSYVYTKSTSVQQKKHLNYKFFILPALLLVLYDPYILTKLFPLFLHLKKSYNFSYSFLSILKYANMINRLWLVVYIVIGFYWLFLDYHNHQIKKIRYRVLNVIFCLTPVFILYFLMFYWFPQQIIILREARTYGLKQISHSFEELRYLDFIHLPIAYKLYPFITLFSLSILIYSFYRYKSFTTYKKIQSDKLNYSMSTAGLGAKVFSHSIKNDLYAIKLVMEKCLTGKIDTAQINRIIMLCDINLERLNTLNSKLNINISDLEPHEVEECISVALNKIKIPDNIKLDMHLADYSMKAYMNVEYLSEAICCILSNSVEAINKLGKAGNIGISVYKRYKEIIISVKDNGCGVKMDKVEKIFSPFYSTKPTTQNWGMGLPYCSKIVLVHNGEIHFKSVKNEGSEVTILIPSEQ